MVTPTRRSSTAERTSPSEGAPVALVTPKPRRSHPKPNPPERPLAYPQMQQNIESACDTFWNAEP